MAVPSEDIAACQDSHARLHVTLAGLDEATVRRPSLLPEWTVAHVLTHLTRNADSVVRRLAAAMEGQLVEQYAGGQPGRAADIEAGSGRAVGDLVAELRAADGAVDDLFAGVPEAVWDRPVLTGAGGQMPAARLAWSRRREVEIHHVDLGLSYTSTDWPEGLVDRLLPDLVADLDERGDRRALLAWLLGRGPAPPLGPWG